MIFLSFAEVKETSFLNAREKICQHDSSEDAVWSLLLAGGYLCLERYSLNKRGYPDYELKLTNREVSIMFEKMIDGWFKQSASAYNAFIKALLFGDTDAMNTYINRVVAITFNYFDTGKAPSKETDPERFYHEQKHRVRIGYLLRERRSMRSGSSGRIKEFR